MLTIQDVIDTLERLAPKELAAEWDNVGLLVGDADRRVARVMTCLSVTSTSAAEAIERRCDLIVVHHPMPFHPMKRLTSETPEGRVLLALIAVNVSIYSAHTAFDSAREGINDTLASELGLHDVAPLIPSSGELGDLGTGRFGRFGTPLSLGALVNSVKTFLRINGMHVVGDLSRSVGTLGIACGSAAEFLHAAREVGCDALLTGEASFHRCLEAQAHDMMLLLPGHFASERFGMECLARRLAQIHPELEFWASKDESDPLLWC